MLPYLIENGLIESIVEAPSGVPLDLFEECLFRQQSLTPAIQYGLLLLLKHLHGNDYVFPILQEFLNKDCLNPVLFDLVVTFSEKDDVCRNEFGHELDKGDLLSARELEDLLRLDGFCQCLDFGNPERG